MEVKYTKEQKSLLIIGIIFSVIGAVFVCLGIFFTKQLINYKNEYQEVLATVLISSEDEEMTFITYKYNNTNYTFAINYYSSANDPGDLLTSYVNPNNPTQIVIMQEVVTFQIVFYSIGFIFLIMGLPFALSQKISMSKINYLLKKGEKVRAIIKEEKENIYYSYNNRHPFNLYAMYNSHEFKSKRYWKSLKKDGIRQSVNVYHIDYKNYYVDLTSIKEIIDFDEDIFAIDDKNY